MSRMTLGPTKPPIQWVPGALSLGVKQPGHEVDHSSPLVPRSRMHGTTPPLPKYVFMAWCLVKHRDNFTLHSNTRSLLKECYLLLYSHVINLWLFKVKNWIYCNLILCFSGTYFSVTKTRHTRIRFFKLQIY
jgi:hypothetical protein